MTLSKAPTMTVARLLVTSHAAFVDEKKLEERIEAPSGRTGYEKGTQET